MMSTETKMFRELKRVIRSNSLVICICLIILIIFLLFSLHRKEKRIHILTDSIKWNETRFSGDGYSSGYLQIIDRRIIPNKNGVSLLYLLDNADTSSFYQAEIAFLKQMTDQYSSIISILSFRKNKELDHLDLPYRIIDKNQMIFEEDPFFISSAAFLTDPGGQVHTVYYINPHDTIGANSKLQRIESLLKAVSY